MFDIEILIEELSRLAVQRQPLDEAEIFRALRLDMSAARILRTRDGNDIQTDGARSAIHDVAMDALVHLAPDRDVAVLFRGGGPRIGALDMDKFMVDRRVEESGDGEGANVRFFYKGARIGVGYSMVTKEIAIISAEPIDLP